MVTQVRSVMMSYHHPPRTCIKTLNIGHAAFLGYQNELNWTCWKAKFNLNAFMMNARYSSPDLGQLVVKHLQPPQCCLPTHPHPEQSAVVCRNQFIHSQRYGMAVMISAVWLIQCRTWEAQPQRQGAVSAICHQLLASFPGPRTALGCTLCFLTCVTRTASNKKLGGAWERG